MDISAPNHLTTRKGALLMHTLLAQADIACYTAKHQARGKVYLYEARQKRY
ncbi:putative diguanylate cyclase [Serratia proteamaculans]|uniref:GGDEF domain-containing protein n=1 Tax=Serratia proteamaculans TaxID=28151 RepID=A0ABS0TVS6_SERPR|nr:hypothetical protein [Serratia proteamaculans]MBI6182461.1 hypothetical protein [Serratia proteamaculans]CAI2496830.1 putative diguanylate cyclase [Serratia proteamaculans]